MRSLFCLAAACVLLAAQETWAQLPRTISYQGVLADAAGTLVPDAVHTLTFTLYDAASGGTVVFTETQSVPVVRGLFNSILGAATAGGIPPGVAFDRAYFLGISVDGGAELVPRTALTASPYALRAAVADAVMASGVSTTAVADLAITNAKIANNTITTGKIATTGAAAGQALMFNGSNLVYGNPALQLPYTANVNSGSTLLSLTNSGNGIAVVGASAGGTGVWAISNSSSVGSAAVFGQHPNGEAIVGDSSGATVGAVVGRHDGNGYGVYGVNTGSGTGVRGETSGPGIAGEFRNGSPSSTNATLRALSGGMGTVLDIEYFNPSFTGALATFSGLNGRVARIDYLGKGFFNGGTQTGGADVAEAFETAEPVSAYEPGDVLVIATTRNRTVERSSAAYSTRVAGVYATKPGVLLTDRAMDADQSETVPMGIIGVLPTKVSGENGPIQRGDLLVTSTTPGHAMRAGAQPAAGTIIGKALEPFDGEGTGRINVLVSIR